MGISRLVSHLLAFTANLFIELVSLTLILLQSRCVRSARLVSGRWETFLTKEKVIRLPSTVAVRLVSLMDSSFAIFRAP